MTLYSFWGPTVVSPPKKEEGGPIIRPLRLKNWHPLESNINIQGSKTLTPLRYVIYVNLDYSYYYI